MNPVVNFFCRTLPHLKKMLQVALKFEVRRGGYRSDGFPPLRNETIPFSL